MFFVIWFDGYGVTGYDWEEEIDGYWEIEL